MEAALFHPNSWLNHGHWHYLNQTPQRSGWWKYVHYRVNDNAVQEADFLVVHDDVDQPVTLRIPTGNSILITGEEKSAKLYPPEFINQFDVIITSRDDIHHPRVIRTHYYHPWSVKKTYDELMVADPVKSKNLSAVVSSMTVLEGHKNRFAFMNKMKGHFKEQLDWFSKGEQTFIQDKWDGLAPYAYSIAIENSEHPNYFTEKLTDCFLAGTLPFYWGCPNVQEFFDDRSLIRLNIADFPGSVQVVEMALRDELYRQRIPFVQDAKKLVLTKYSFIAALTETLGQFKSSQSRSKKTIKPYRHFAGNSLLNRLKRAAQILINPV